MILPSTSTATLVLLVLSMVCLGCWATTFKLTGKWRFELYYFDFVFGMAVVAGIAALTLGTLGFDGFSFMDDLLHASKKQDLMAFLAGVIFNLGNMLLIAAISVGGMSVAFPISLGLGLIIGVLANYFLRPQGNGALLVSGALLVAIAIGLVIFSYRAYKLSKVDDLVRAGKVKSTRRVVTLNGVIISLVSGLLMGCYPQIIDASRAGDAGLGPYSVAFVFTAGAFASTFMYNLFFMNLPVSGAPLEVFDYFRGGIRQHLLGWVGGMLFISGMLLALVATSTEGAATVSSGVSLGLVAGSIVLATILGWFVWNEFERPDLLVRTLQVLTLALLVAGIGMISAASAWTRG